MYSFVLTEPLNKCCMTDVDGMEKLKEVALSLKSQHFRSSTSKMRVEFAGMMGGYPLLPYAKSGEQVNLAT